MLRGMGARTFSLSVSRRRPTANAEDPRRSVGTRAITTYRHRRRHADRAAMGVLVLKMTASPRGLASAPARPCPCSLVGKKRCTARRGSSVRGGSSARRRLPSRPTAQANPAIAGGIRLRSHRNEPGHAAFGCSHNAATGLFEQRFKQFCGRNDIGKFPGICRTDMGECAQFAMFNLIKAHFLCFKAGLKNPRTDLA